VLGVAIVAESRTLLGKGIYDVDEVARLIRRSDSEVSTWASREVGLLLPQERRVFSFYDLITAALVAELRRRGVPLGKVQAARTWLTTQIDEPWPLAHAVGLRRLASVGRDVYFLHDEAGWLDASLGGQMPFQPVVKPLIRHLDFDPSTRMAARWRPTTGVVLDPTIQAGAPCLEGTRLTTELISDLAAAGEDTEDIAEDYDVDVKLIRQALRYEQQLVA
jgi:uncharacterized protein (DUF433 family)